LLRSIKQQEEDIDETKEVTAESKELD